MGKLKTFLEMIKFEHSIFALPFAYLGLFWASNGKPGWLLFFQITLAMVTFRTMAMAVNRLFDDKIDGKNPRTSSRAIPAGKLSKKYVWMITFLCLGLFEAICFWIHPLCFYLSPIPVFFAWLYPLMKRFSALCHFVLGFVLGIAPYGAWIGATAEFSWIPGLLCLGVICWVSGFDMIYALQDLEFDRGEGLHSIPAKIGQERTLKLTFILHILSVLFWGLAGFVSEFGLWYFIGLIGVGFFLLRQNFLIKKYDLGKLQEAFFSMNALVSVALFLFTLFEIYF